MGRNSHARGKESGFNEVKIGKLESKLPAARPVCKVSRYMSDSMTLGRH